jgi:dephospho-CoA kinase
MNTFPDIIGVVGPIRAGKTTAAKYLVDNYGYKFASNSEVLKRILAGMGMIPSRANLASLGNSIFEVFGNDLIARYRLDNLHLGRIVVDGIRYTEELKRYSEISNFKLIGLTADSDTRFDRTLKGSEEFKDVEISRAAFDQFAQSRSELSVPELLAFADVVIPNVGTVEDLHLVIDNTLQGWS